MGKTSSIETEEHNETHTHAHDKRRTHTLTIVARLRMILLKMTVAKFTPALSKGRNCQIDTDGVCPYLHDSCGGMFGSPGTSRVSCFSKCPCNSLHLCKRRECARVDEKSSSGR